MYIHQEQTVPLLCSLLHRRHHYRQYLWLPYERACTCTSPLLFLLSPYSKKEVAWQIAQLKGYQAWICYTSEFGRQPFTTTIGIHGSSPHEAGHPEKIDDIGLVFMLPCKQSNRRKLCNPILPNWQLFQGSFVNWEHDMYWSCFFIMHLALTGESVKHLRYQHLGNKILCLQSWLSN